MSFAAELPCGMQSMVHTAPWLPGRVCMAFPLKIPHTLAQLYIQAHNMQHKTLTGTEYQADQTPPGCVRSFAKKTSNTSVDGERLEVIQTL